MWPAAAQPLLFLKKLHHSAKVFSTHPNPRTPRALSFHDTWTYDSSRRGLSFNVCQGQSSQHTHTWQGEAALRGRVVTSAKVAEEVIVVAQGDTTIFMSTDHHLACPV